VTRKASGRSKEHSGRVKDTSRMENESRIRMVGGSGRPKDISVRMMQDTSRKLVAGCAYDGL